VSAVLDNKEAETEHTGKTKKVRGTYLESLEAYI